ncbi:MAG: hypothetical protein ACYTGC_11690, partial [Planctomycetota bacterium]
SSHADVQDWCYDYLDDGNLGMVHTIPLAVDCVPPARSDTDCNGAVDVDDLRAVILDWGTDGREGRTDIDASGTVDVDDLLHVLLAWGPWI